MTSRRVATALIVILTLAASAPADVKLPQVFSDNMVLQRDIAAPVWGTAAPGEQVTVEFAGQKQSATAGADGRWRVTFTGLKPGGPGEIKVTGNNALVIKNILIGEVWDASGQSNMKFRLAQATDGPAEVAKATHPQIRYYSVERGQWFETSPRVAGTFSAIAYYFAVDLHGHLNVPVGIVENALSGALVQTFMSPELLGSDPSLIKGVKPSGQTPSENWNALVKPVVGYGIRGVIWFQGEGNRDFPQTYAKAFAAMIADWRKQWAQGDFPFLICQLANVGKRTDKIGEGRDRIIREAQQRIVQNTKNTALIVTIDLNTIEDVHFPNKKPAGQRLALAARALAYGEKIEYAGPTVKDVKFEGAQAVVTFEHSAGGLEARGGTLKGFQLAGADKQFVRADATIDGDRVIVTSDSARRPVAVRYAFEPNPEVTLYNKAGLPAVPFRSDTWENYFTRDDKE